MGHSQGQKTLENVPHVGENPSAFALAKKSRGRRSSQKGPELEDRAGLREARFLYGVFAREIFVGLSNIGRCSQHPLPASLYIPAIVSSGWPTTGRAYSRPLRSPLLPEIIVVQSNGMRRCSNNRSQNAMAFAQRAVSFPQKFFRDFCGTLYLKPKRRIFSIRR